MQAIGKRLTYANVVSTLALFLVLAGGAAYAAKVGKKSVGPAQLKANAVTTAKIKANAVTTRKIKRNAVANAKIKDGAVESAKIADGSVTRTDLAEATMPFSRIVHEARGNSTVAARNRANRRSTRSPTPPTPRKPDSDDSFDGRPRRHASNRPAMQAPRNVQAYVLLDAAKPTELTDARRTRRRRPARRRRRGRSDRRPAQARPYIIGDLGSSPATATSHTLSLVADPQLRTGDGGARRTFGAADVIGTKK